MSWTFVDGGGCGDSSVTDVRVSALDEVNASAVARVFDCGDGSDTVADVPPGTYTVTVEGVGADGFVKADFGIASVVVTSGRTAQVSASLAAVTGSIRFGWTFDSATACPGDVSKIEPIATGPATYNPGRAASSAALACAKSPRSSRTSPR